MLILLFIEHTIELENGARILMQGSDAKPITFRFLNENHFKMATLRLISVVVGNHSIALSKSILSRLQLDHSQARSLHIPKGIVSSNHYIQSSRQDQGKHLA